MKPVSPAAVGLVLTALAGASCSTTAVANPATAPEALRPPAGQVLFLEVPAVGVQIYECAASRDNPARFEWTFKTPEAKLLDRSGRSLGIHYGGPTWESVDGSTVVAEVRARDGGTDANAIPWLLLGAKSTSGSGVFSRVRSIQRLETAGGKAPSEPCTAEQTARVARVPYTATYYFYGDKV
jgi:hypothetical protein